MRCASVTVTESNGVSRRQLFCVGGEVEFDIDPSISAIVPKRIHDDSCEVSVSSSPDCCRVVGMRCVSSSIRARAGSRRVNKPLRISPVRTSITINPALFLFISLILYTSSPRTRLASSTTEQENPPPSAAMRCSSPSSARQAARATSRSCSAPTRQFFSSS